MKQIKEVVSSAMSKHVRTSPYKLRPFADVVRGKRVVDALAWLKTYGSSRTVPLFKVIASAFANAKNKQPENVELNKLCVSEIQVCDGGIVRYFKPGARGRANPQRKRMSHLRVSLGIK
jgi:large subunit ribosomal protein L22